MRSTTPFVEATMAEQSRDAKTTTTEPEKKQPETVLLTSEELRAIAGGAGVSAPQPVAKALTANPNKNVPGA
jgi:hypothetical protein